METQPDNKHIQQWSDWQKYLSEYIVDSVQRSIIFTDILRKRGNNYIKHIRSGQPPVLAFNYELILNAKTFKHPSNYALVRISERRSKDLPFDNGKSPSKNRKASDQTQKAHRDH